MSNENGYENEHFDFGNKLFEMLPVLERLRTSVVGILDQVLADSEIEYLPVLSRVKAMGSAKKKQSVKNYKDPSRMMTDLVGARIVLLLESDIDRVLSLLRKSFEVDESNSVDRRASLRSNEFGYKSIHLICSLGKSRKNLPEYQILSELKFEIQVRTALQHTWAEIEHKRNYKGQSALPPELTRRLNAAAASLELVDHQLAEIASQADQYSKKVAATDTTVQNDPVTVAGLTAIAKRSIGKPISLQGTRPSVAASELKSFGIVTIHDLEKLLKTEASKAITSYYKAADEIINFTGFYREIMMANDTTKYFDKSYQSDWSGMSADGLTLLSAASQNPGVESLLRANGIRIF